MKAITRIGLDTFAKKQSIKHENERIASEKRQSENEIAKQKAKQVKIATLQNEIDFCKAEKEKVVSKINNLKHPTGMNISTDIETISKEYSDIKKLIVGLKDKIFHSSQTLMTLTGIVTIELTASVLIVFIVTRIISSNSLFQKQITAFKIVQQFYPNIAKADALAINLFIQDALLIGSGAILIGYMTYNFNAFKSKDTQLYGLFGALLSVFVMFIANIFSDL